MAQTYALDKRCTDILKMVVYAGGYVSVSEITDQLGISKRSAYYDIEKINDWLRDNSLPELERDRFKGIRAESNEAAKIQALLFQDKVHSHRAFSPVERERLAICMMILHEKPVYVETLMDICDVSRNTTVSDLKDVASFLKKNKLKLHYLIKKGYRIQGDPVKKRALFFLFFPQFIDYFAQSLISEKQVDIIRDIQLNLKEIEHELHCEYVSGMLPTLAVFLASIRMEGPCSEDEISFSDIDMRDITETQEYKLVCRYFDWLSKPEKIYAALHLLGSRTQTEPILVEKGEKEAKEIASMLVRSFEEISGIRYGDQGEIIKALASHLKTSLYRYRYGIQLGNPMLESIRTEYKELFELTKAAFLRISDEIGFHVADAEIAYLTLHFGAFMSPEDTVNRPYRILIICPNGVGTSNMIKSEVRRLVPKATEVRNIPLSRYSSDCPYDVIISTVPIENEKRLIIVNPILNDQDRVAILRKCINTEPSAKIQIDEVMRIARKYISSDKIAAFEEEIAGCFSALKVPEAPRTDFGAGIMQYLQPSHIQLIPDKIDWKEALVRSCRPLLLDDSITQEYVDAILEEQTQQHHYMFLTDGLVLAHSKSEHGVKKVDAAMTVFKEPVTWENGKMVHIIVSIAAEDQTKHIRILNDILDIFSKKQSLEQIPALSSPLKVREYLQRRLDAAAK